MRKLFASLFVMSALLSAGIANAALVSKNAYAYDIAVDNTSSTTKVYVSYKLNAVASAVTIQAYAGEDLKGEFAGTTNASNSVAIPLADLPLSTEISFKIKVTSTNQTSPVQANIDGTSSNNYSFYAPYGIAVDNDPASAHFGRVLVTETKVAEKLTDGKSSTSYISSTLNGGIGVGIYAFDPEMQPIQNASGTYGFTAGVNIQTGTYSSEHAASPDPIMDFKHIRYSADGRLFLSSEQTEATSLYEIDPDNLESGATAIFQGTPDETTGYVQSGDDFISGPASAMDVYGSGSDLKIAILTTKYGQSTDPTDHRVDIYNLGTASSWSAVPSENVEALSGQYWDNDTGINMLFDADGNGLMISQARSEPSETEPSRVHYSFTNSKIDYTDITSVIYGGAMAWNPDKTLVAMAKSVTGIGIYEMYYDDEDLVLDEKYSITVSGSGKVCALAWDYAGNLYVGANGSETVTTYAIPRESADVVVPVTTTITTPETVPDEEEEEEEVHELGEKNAYAYDIAVSHDDTTATVSYRLNANPESVEILVYIDGEPFDTIEGTAVAGKNTVVIPLSELPANTEASFSVKVTSKTITSPTQATITDNDNDYWKFYSPFGLVVDNNPESANFGRVLVTETKPGVVDQDTSKGYISLPALNGVGVGVYAFDPQLQPIKNSDGGYGFTLGITKQSGNDKHQYDGAAVDVMDFKQLRLSADGRLFLGCEETVASSLWELDPDNLEADATEIFQGTLDDSTGYVEAAGGDFIAGPAVAFDVWGAGSDLKVAILSCKGGASTNYTSYHRVDLYNLGTATSWSSAPSMKVEPLSETYWIADNATNMLFDLDGNGLTVVQSRTSPSSTEPSIVHVKDLDSTPSEDFKSYDFQTMGGALAWNCDSTMFVLSTSTYGANSTYNGYVTIYSFNKETSQFTSKYKFDTGAGTYLNGLAWDVADNLYVCSNSGERLVAWAIPQDDPAVTVAAPSASAFEVPVVVAITLDEAEDLTATSVTLSAEVVANEAITEYGFQYGQTEEWEDAEKVSAEADEDGNIVATIDGLKASTEYVFRAYAVIDGEYYYGLGESFVTSDAVIITSITFEEGSTTAVVKGQTAEGIEATEIGILYGESSDIDNASEVTDIYVNKDITGMIGTLSDLTGGTEYYVWAYAVVDGETYYSEMLSFTAGDDTTTGVDALGSDAACAQVSVLGNEIMISGEFASASIYNTAGVAVVAKAGASNTVRSGIYIVVVDGKATKVAVR